MDYIVYDLEATCDEHRVPMNEMEIIEIGAVRLGPDLLPRDEFASFVRPVLNPLLSEFCKNLTHIRQEDVDKADDFKTVFPKFVDWVGSRAVVFCSWGAYDQKQIGIDCSRHGIPVPEIFNDHINLKAFFAKRFTIKPCGMHKALEKIGLPLVGSHHRGIDDSRNIAKIAQILLKDEAMVPDEKGEKADAIIQQAHAALDSGDFEKAIALYGEAIALIPEDGDGYFLRAKARIAKADKEKVRGAHVDYSDAIADLTAAIEKIPGYEEAYFTRGCIYYRLKLFPKAQADFARAPRRQPIADILGHDRDMFGLAGFYKESIKGL